MSAQFSSLTGGDYARSPAWPPGSRILWQSNATSQPRVLVLDDDANLLRLLRMILRTSGFEAEVFDDAYLALDAAELTPFDVVILDLRMPNVDGRAFFRELRARGIETPVLIASAYGARGAQLELGAEASIEKPFDPDVLVETVQRLIDNASTAGRRPSVRASTASLRFVRVR